MSKINKYILDFTKVEQWNDIHIIIAEGLDFPDRYGFNLDILDEFLTEMVLTEKSSIEICGLERLKKYNGYDNKIYNAFLGAKHSYGKEYAKNFQVSITWENGITETLPNELERYNFILDFTEARTENDVISEFIRSFKLDPGETKNYNDIWHFLLIGLTLRVSYVELRGLENLKNIDNCHDTVVKILEGIKENWNGKYSDRFFVKYS